MTLSDDQVNLDLAEADLPNPSALRDHAEQSTNEQRTQDVNADLAKLDLRDPEAIHPEGHVHNDPEDGNGIDDEARAALLDAIAGLKLPDPERYLRAIMKADGIVRWGFTLSSYQKNLTDGCPHHRKLQSPCKLVFWILATLKRNSLAHSKHSSEMNVVAPLADAPSQPLLSPATIDQTNPPAVAGTQPPIDPSQEASTSASQQKITPWDVEGAVVDGKQMAIDYDKLTREFGTKPIDATMLERFEKLTGHKPHTLLRRGIFFSHRCVQVYHHSRDTANAAKKKRT